MGMERAINQYQQSGIDFLTRHNLKFNVVFIGEDCPKFCEDAAKNKSMNEIGKFPRRSHIHGSHWRITLSREGKADFIVDYWDSYHDAEVRAIGTEEYRRGKQALKYGPRFLKTVEVGHGQRQTWAAPGPPKPTPYDVLACIEKSDPGTFEDFCSNFGYDEDSRKAFDVYGAVQKQFAELSRFLTPQELAEAQEIS